GFSGDPRLCHNVLAPVCACESDDGRHLRAATPEGRLTVTALRRVLAVVIALLIAMTIVAPGTIAVSDPYTMDPGRRLQAPTLEHPFGTDEFGRDVFSRVVYGARLSTGLALLVVALSVVVGCTIGLIAGYAGGMLDNVLMRIVDIFLAFPQLILAIAIASALGQNVFNAVLGLAGVWWAQYARV